MGFSGGGGIKIERGCALPADVPERLGRLEERMDAVEHDLNDNGQKGLITISKEFFTRADERAKNEKEFRELRDKEIKEALEHSNELINQHIAEATLVAAQTGAVLTRKSLAWTIAGVFVAIAAFGAAILFGVASWYVAKHAGVEPLDLLRSVQPSLALRLHSPSRTDVDPNLYTENLP